MKGRELEGEELKTAILKAMKEYLGEEMLKIRYVLGGAPYNGVPRTLDVVLSELLKYFSENPVVPS